MYFLSIPIHNGHKWLVNARNNLAEMHSRVCRMFTPAERDTENDFKSAQRHGIRWRIERRDPHNPGSREYLLVQSKTEPELHYHYPDVDDHTILHLSPAQPVLFTGQLVAFTFVGNPTKAHTSPTGKPRRVPIQGTEAVTAWGAERLASIHDVAGQRPWAELDCMTGIAPAYGTHPLHVAYKGDGTEVRLSLWRYTGFARITDPVAARLAVHQGIRSPARGYGTGLLTLAPARPY